MTNADITARAQCDHAQPVSVLMHCNECDAGRWRVVPADAIAVSLTDEQWAALVNMLRHQARAIERYDETLGGAMRSLLEQLTT